MLTTDRSRAENLALCASSLAWSLVTISTNEPCPFGSPTFAPIFLSSRRDNQAGMLVAATVAVAVMRAMNSGSVRAMESGEYHQTHQSPGIRPREGWAVPGLTRGFIHWDQHIGC